MRDRLAVPWQELAAAGEQFDMVFIDADKDNYINYYNFILDNNLLRMRGVICVDNTLFKSKVYLKHVTDANGLALRRFNQFVSADPRVEQVAFFFLARSLVAQLHQQQLFFFSFTNACFLVSLRSFFLSATASASSAGCLRPPRASRRR